MRFYFFSMGFFYSLPNRAHNFGLHNVFIKWSMDGWMDERNKRELKAINGMVITLMDE
jgi:hypothetical protein